MSNDFYNASGTPATGAFAASAAMRTEFNSVAAGFDKLPTLTANKAVVVNSAGTALTVTTGSLALGGNLTVSGTHATTLVAGADVSLTLPIVSGTLATLAGTEILTNKTLTAPTITGPTITGTVGGAATYSGITLTTPVLGTPASGTLTNCVGLPADAVLSGALANGMTATTQAPGDDSTKIATTAYVTDFLSVGSNSVQAFLAATVNLNNIATYFDGPNTGAVGAAGEKWQITVTATAGSTTGISEIELAIWNGSTYLANATEWTVGANLPLNLSCTAVATLAGATTFTLRARDSNATTSQLLTTGGNAVTNKGTSITAVRLS